MKEKTNVFNGKPPLTLVMLNTDVSDEAVELEGEREDVVVVRGITDHEGSVRLRCQDPFGRLAGQWTPVPTMLKSTGNVIAYYLKQINSNPFQCNPILSKNKIK